MKDTIQSEDWNLVIKGHTSLFDLKFNDVWRYRDLLWMFVKRDFVSFYKQTILNTLIKLNKQKCPKTIFTDIQ